MARHGSLAGPWGLCLACLCPSLAVSCLCLAVSGLELHTPSSPSLLKAKKLIKRSRFSRLSCRRYGAHGVAAQAIQQMIEIRSRIEHRTAPARRRHMRLLQSCCWGTCFLGTPSTPPVCLPELKQLHGVASTRDPAGRANTNTNAVLFVITDLLNYWPARLDHSLATDPCLNRINTSGLRRSRTHHGSRPTHSLTTHNSQPDSPPSCGSRRQRLGIVFQKGPCM